MRLPIGTRFLIPLFLAAACTSQPKQPAAPKDVAGRLKELCQLITSSSADKNKTILAFTTIDAGVLRREAAIPDKRHPEFYPDSIYSIFAVPANPEGTPSVKRTMQTWHRGAGLFYEVRFQMESRYHTVTGRQPVFEDPLNSLQISHALLAQIFGKAVSLFPEAMQPKESHYDYYTYINPETRDTAFIKTRSFMSPASNDNIIYDIFIVSSSLDPVRGRR